MIELTALASDDGMPEPLPAMGGPVLFNARGLRVSWFV